MTLPTTPADLLALTCNPKAKALTKPQVTALLSLLPGWKRKAQSITRTLKFKNYYETLAFLNASALISHHQNHHPDIQLTYNTLTLTYTTHDANGLTLNDFICAAKVDQL
jgi:4a-hydroxytetrahydrobiopterin dehydratase